MKGLVKGTLLAGALVVASFSIGRYTADHDARVATGDSAVDPAQESAQAPTQYGVASGASVSTRTVAQANYDPATATMTMEDRVVELDDRLRTEPVSPEWAARSSIGIREALSQERLKDFNASEPKSLEVSCRSTACRISMAFDDPIAAPDTVTALTAGIAAQFPEVVVVPINGEHGVQYHVFATANRGSALFRTGRPPARTPDSCGGRPCKG